MTVDGKVKGKDQLSEKKGFFKFLKEVKAETKRITWPSKKEVKKATIAVATFCLICIVLIGGMDMILQNLSKIGFGIK